MAAVAATTGLVGVSSLAAAGSDPADGGFEVPTTVEPRAPTTVEAERVAPATVEPVRADPVPDAPEIVDAGEIMPLPSPDGWDDCPACGMG